jgi:prophage tail gpP-like protein
MIQSFDFRINGRSEPIVSGELIRTVDTACDGFVVNLPINLQTQRDLYNLARPRTYAKCQIYLNSELFLTGKKTRVDPSFSNSGRAYALHGFSNTFNFMDSALKPPYEYNNQPFENIADQVAAQTGTKVIHDAPQSDQITRATVEPGQTGFEFLVPLAKERNRVISSDQQGNILIQQADVSSKSVGVIEEGNQADLISQEFQASFDDRKAFRSYKVTSQTPFGRYQGNAVDKSVPEPRHKLISVDTQTPGAIEQVAEWQLHLQLIEDFKLEIPVVGWYAPNGDLWRVNTIATFVSETCFIPDGFDLYIRGVRYVYGSSGRTAVLSLVPPNVYTERPIILPWAPVGSVEATEDFLSQLELEF